MKDKIKGAKDICTREKFWILDFGLISLANEWLDEHGNKLLDNVIEHIALKSGGIKAVRYLGDSSNITFPAKIIIRTQENKTVQLTLYKEEKKTTPKIAIDEGDSFKCYDISTEGETPSMHLSSYSAKDEENNIGLSHLSTFEYDYIEFLKGGYIIKIKIKNPVEFENSRTSHIKNRELLIESINNLQLPTNIAVISKLFSSCSENNSCVPYMEFIQEKVAINCDRPNEQIDRIILKNGIIVHSETVRELKCGAKVQINGFGVKDGYGIKDISLNTSNLLDEIALSLRLHD